MWLECKVQQLRKSVNNASLGFAALYAMERREITVVECLDSSLEFENDLLHAWLILLMRYSQLRMRAMPAHHNHYGMSKT